MFISINHYKIVRLAQYLLPRLPTKIGFGLFALMLLCTPYLMPVAIAQASDANTNLDKKIEEIIVHSSRVSDTIEHATIQVEVLTKVEIESQGAHFFDELLQGRSSIAISYSGGRGHLQELRIRGGESNHTQIRLDGIELNDPGLGDSGGLEHISLIGINQVELLKGAQSGIWGNNALSSTINLRTEPQVDGNRTYASVGYGNLDTYSLQGGYVTKNDAKYLRIDASHYRTDGINVSLIGDETDAYRNTTLHINTGYGDTVSTIRLVLRAVAGLSDFDAYIGGLPTDSTQQTQTNQYYGLLEASHWITPEYKTLMQINRLQTDAENSNQDALESTIHSTRTTVTWQNEIYLQQDKPYNQRLILAFEYSSSTFDQRAPVSPFGDPNQGQVIAKASMIAEYEFIGQRFLAGLAIRYDDSSAFKNSFAFRASGKYRSPNQKTTLGVTVASGIKDPTFNERFGYSPSSFLGNPNLKSEKSSSISAFIEHQPTQWADLALTIYHDRLIDEINGFVFDFNSNRFTAANQDGLSNRFGVELSAKLNWSSVTVLAWYGYLRATQENNSLIEDEIRRPSHNGGMRLTYQYRKGLSTQLGFVYVGQQKDNIFTSFPAQTVNLDAYSLLDLSLNWEFRKNFETSIKVRNLLNKKYTSVFGYNNEPRTIMLNLKFNLI